MRAVLDTNVVISALLNPAGTPARVVRAWQDGAFEYVASEQLIAEIERALTYPKVRARIDPPDGKQFVNLLRSQCELPTVEAVDPPLSSPDPHDDFLIALAYQSRSLIVTGDDDLLGLAPRLPVVTPAAFLELIDE